METGGYASNGLAEYLVIYDTARITEDGTPELLQWLALSSSVQRSGSLRWRTRPQAVSPGSLQSGSVGWDLGGADRRPRLTGVSAVVPGPLLKREANGGVSIVVLTGKSWTLGVQGGVDLARAGSS